MPHTRWWRWTSPVRTDPGHHDTPRLRRALLRIAKNEITNDSRTRNAAPDPARERSPNGSTLTSAALIAEAVIDAQVSRPAALRRQGGRSGAWLATPIEQSASAVPAGRRLNA